MTQQSTTGKAVRPSVFSFLLVLFAFPAHSEDIFLDTVRKSNSPPGFVIDVNAVPIYEVGGRIVFEAVHPTLGQELYVSDGTREGTTLLRDIAVGNRSAEANVLLKHNDRLYFNAVLTETNRSVLFETRGTRASTRPLPLMKPATSMLVSQGRLFAASNNELYEIFDDSTAMLLGDNVNTQQTMCSFETGNPLRVKGFDDAGNSILLDLVGNTLVNRTQLPDNFEVETLIGSYGGACIVVGDLEDEQNFSRDQIVITKADGSTENPALQLNRRFGDQLTEVDGYVYFFANGQTNSGLFRTVAPFTNFELVDDQNFGGRLFSDNNRVYFDINNSPHTIRNNETVPIKLIEAETLLLPAKPDYAHAFGGVLISSGVNLWWTDGTPGNTQGLFSVSETLLNNFRPNSIRFLSTGVEVKPGGPSIPGFYFSRRVGVNRGGAIMRLTSDNLIRESLTGDWTSTELNDQGLLLFNSALENNQKFLFAAWFTYENGKPVWFAGNANYSGSETVLELPMVRTSGLEFANPSADLRADREIAGVITITPEGCSQISVAYDFLDFGADSVKLEPLFRSNNQTQCKTITTEDTQ